MAGILYLVGLPIGNKEDITLRALDVLKNSVQRVLAEDTRRARILFQEYGIQAILESFFDHKEKESTTRVVQLLESGENIALVSDAGMPCVSDPGYFLVKSCYEAGIPVKVIPGVSALLTALAGSGIAPLPSTFLGFLPRSASEQKALFALYPCSSLLFFERKDRVHKTLCNAYETLGDRPVCIARELTKIHEEYIRTTLETVYNKGLSKDLLGEVTVVIEKAFNIQKTPHQAVLDAIATLPPIAMREKVRILQQQTQGYTAKELYALIETAKQK